MTSTILPQAAGYGSVIGIGLFFSALMIALTALQARYTPYSPWRNAEEFNTASRSVKPGLISSGIVSAWTWVGTLLESSAAAYTFGISGPWWYGAGSTVQILLFALLAAKLKLNAPYAHTWLEIIHARWGRTAHLVFLCFGLTTNVIVSSMLVLAGSATVAELSGMSSVAACFLIPFCVALYVVVGGMRSTLLCDYTHTSVLFFAVLIFAFTVYTASPQIGSPAKMHTLLTKAAQTKPVPGNRHGSYLTLRSRSGLIYGITTLVGNFSTVFTDQAYWQRAIASQPASTVRAYLMGGLAWFALPFMFATTLGLAGVALSVGGADPEIQRRLLSMSQEDLSAGLPAVVAASALLGQGGASAMLVLLFLAVTSSLSAELIAVSSLVTYDVYKMYLNPQAREEQIMKVGHAAVVGYAALCGVAGVGFGYVGVQLVWLDSFIGVVLGSAVCPIALAITWKKAHKWGCIVGSVVGFVAGVVSWLVITAKLERVVNVVTTGGDYEMLAGNLVSIGIGTIISVATSLIWPDDFDFESTRAINRPAAVTSDSTSSRSYSVKLEDVNRDTLTLPDGEKENMGGSVVKDKEEPASLAGNLLEETDELHPVALNRAFRFAAWSSIGLFMVLIILVPLPLFFSGHVFPVAGFTIWVSVGIVWTFVSAVIVVLYPLYESRNAIGLILSGIYKDLFTNQSGKYMHESRPVRTFVAITV